jgi:hypothetical protein
MIAGQMSGFMGEHTDEFPRCLRLHDGAHIHKNTPPVCDKGIEGFVIDQSNFNIGIAKPCRLENRRDIIAHQRFNLRITNEAEAAGALGHCRGNHLADDQTRNETHARKEHTMQQPI